MNYGCVAAIIIRPLVCCVTLNSAEDGPSYFPSDESLVQSNVARFECIGGTADASVRSMIDVSPVSLLPGKYR